MSSLAGALVPPRSLSSPSKSANMHDEPEEGNDLFGDDEEEEEAGSASGHDSERLPSQERDYRKAMEYAEDELPQDVAFQELKEAAITFPNLPVPQSSDGNKWVLRMPNFVKLDSKPFHPDTYMGPEHDEDDQQAEHLREQSMTIKLKVENTVRWRWTKDELGNDIRQTNSRVIRWSDGSLSLRLGKELFDINQSVDTAGGVHRQSLGGSNASQSHNLPVSHTPGGKSQGLTYLVAQHKTSQVLQSEALVTGYLSLRPTGMQSETHRMLVKAVGQRHNKVARLRMAPDPTVDPEREVNEAIKKAKRSAPRRNTNSLSGGAPKRRRSKKEYDSDGDMFSDDEDERRPRTSDKKRARKDEDGQADYQGDGFVVSDEDEDSDDDRHRTAKEDDLDRLEAAAEKQAKQRAAKPARRGPDRDDEDEGMDVESEEEDEEPKVRRATGSRRKRAMYDEAEEEEE